MSDVSAKWADVSRGADADLSTPASRLMLCDVTLSALVSVCASGSVVIGGRSAARRALSPMPEPRMKRQRMPAPRVSNVSQLHPDLAISN